MNLSLWSFIIIFYYIDWIEAEIPSPIVRRRRWIRHRSLNALEEAKKFLKNLLQSKPLEPEESDTTDEDQSKSKIESSSPKTEDVKTFVNQKTIESDSDRDGNVKQSKKSIIQAWVWNRDKTKINWSLKINK